MKKGCGQARSLVAIRAMSFFQCFDTVDYMIGKTSSRKKPVPIITSAEEGGYVFGSVCLSVFGGDPDHASDPGVQSPKSGSFGSAEVCAL